MKTYKKFLCIALCILFVAVVFSGCATVGNPINSETPDITPTHEPTTEPTNEPTTEPTATPAETTKLKELEYTDKGAVSPHNRAFVSDRDVFVEYALPGESKPFINYDVKLRLFETEYQDFDYVYPGLQIVIELTSKEDKSVEYLKSGFVDCLPEAFSWAYIAMVQNLSGNGELMFFVTINDFYDTTYIFSGSSVTKIAGSPYEFGKNTLIMQSVTDIIGYKNIFIEYDVHYKLHFQYFDAMFLERRAPSKIEFAISNNEGYPDKTNDEDTVPYHTVLQEFEAFIMTAKGNYIKGKIEAGERLKPVATDRMGRVYFETNTGKKGYFEYSLDAEKKLYLVSGLDQYEVFDGIANAG